MGVRGSLTIAFIGFLLSIKVCLAQNFSDWGLVEQRDFIALAQKLYILGDRSTPSGLFQTQLERIEEVQHLLNLGSEENTAPLQTALERLFRLETSIADRSYEFRNKIREEPEVLNRLYENVLQSLPDDCPKTIDNVLTRLSFEVDQKLFYLRHPLIAENIPFAGIRGKKLSDFRKFLPPIEREKLNDSVINRLNQNEPDFSTDDSLKQLLYEASMKWGQELKLDLPLRGDIQTTGYLWILEKYGNEWPRLQDLAREPDKDNKWRDRFTAEIDERIVDLFDADLAFKIRKAQDQILSPRFINLKEDEFTYYQLEEDERNLFAGRLFPELSIASARALIERRFFEISEADRMGILNELFPDDISAAQKFSDFRLVRFDSPPAVREFHSNLLHAYFKNLENRKHSQPESLQLLSGIHLPWIGKERDEMRALIEQHKGEIQTGIYPSWLIEALMVRFYPSEDHLKNEGLRFSNEWKRRRLMENSLEEIADLQKKGTENAALIAEKVQKLNAELASTGIDPQSEATLLAAFTYGLTPKNWHDLKGIGKAFGVGFAFVVVTRFVGWKAVSLFIFTDTGLRFMTAEYFSDSGEPLNLDKGISTPIGLWTARSMQDSMNLIHRLVRDSDPEDRLNAAADLGRFARDAIAASLGAAAANITLDFARTKRIQKIRGMEREIRELKLRIEDNRRLIESLQSKLEVVQKELADLERAHLGSSKQGLSKQNLKNEILHKISQLEGESGKAYQSRLEFYSKQLFAEILRVVDYVLPLKSKISGIKPEGLIERWSRRRSLGIRQYETQIAALENAIAKVDRANFLAESSASRWTEPLDYKKLRSSYRKYVADQNALARSIGESEALKNAGDFEGFLKSLEKAGDRLASQSNEIEALRSSMRDPGSSFSDRAIQSVDQWIQKNIRSPLLRERAVATPDLSLGKSTERFFSELKFATQDQWKLMIDKVLQSEPPISSPNRGIWASTLDKIQTQQAAASKALSGLTN